MGTWPREHSAQLKTRHYHPVRWSDRSVPPTLPLKIYLITKPVKIRPNLSKYEVNASQIPYVMGCRPKFSGESWSTLVVSTTCTGTRPRWSATSRRCLEKFVVSVNIRNFRDSHILILAFLAVLASKYISKGQGYGSDVSDHGTGW